MNASTGLTHEQIVDEIVSQVFADKNLSDEQRETLDKSIRSLAAVNGVLSSTGLRDIAYIVRRCMA